MTTAAKIGETAGSRNQVGGLLLRYLAIISISNLIWEFAQMPLYTLWVFGTPREIIFAAIHCTGGDILIAGGAIGIAIFTLGRRQWPNRRYRRVACATLAVGVAYTVFSEWFNTEVRQAWAYRDAMPIIPVIGVGLAPVIQWLALPTLAFWLLPRISPERFRGRKR